LNKILLIRFSSIGDIVLATPVIRALKKQLKCELHVIIKRNYLEVLTNNPFVDKIHVFEKSPDKIFEQLNSEKFDFVVDLQKNFRSIRLRKQLKVNHSTFPKVNIEKWLLVNFKINRLPNIHIVDRYFEAVKKLNVVNDQLGLDYFITNSDKVNPDEIHPELKNGYICFVIGGRHNTKILPAQKAISIINKLHLPVVLLGGTEDEERGNIITTDVTKNHVYNLCGKYNLNQSASWVQQAKLIITNDTGLMHIAAALHKPIISIWGNTIPGFGMFPYFPENQKISFISEVKGLSCRPCSKIGFRQCPKKHFKCMLNQDETTIVHKAIELTTKRA
jgi:ADP-heptose:LPS heptosyltransferase